jgi:hypothetical protein
MSSLLILPFSSLSRVSISPFISPSLSLSFHPFTDTPNRVTFIRCSSRRGMSLNYTTSGKASVGVLFRQTDATKHSRRQPINYWLNSSNSELGWHSTNTIRIQRELYYRFTDHVDILTMWFVLIQHATEQMKWIASMFPDEYCVSKIGSQASKHIKWFQKAFKLGTRAQISHLLQHNYVTMTTTWYILQLMDHTYTEFSVFIWRHYNSYVLYSYAVLRFCFNCRS